MHDMLKPKPLLHVSRFVLLRVTTLIIAMFAAASCGADSKTATNRFERDIVAFEAADHKNPPPKEVNGGRNLWPLHAAHDLRIDHPH
jgi:hypothetical protein